MIKLNLLEKKKPIVLPVVLGVDLNQLNLKMLGISLVIYYMPNFVIDSMYDSKMEALQSSLAVMEQENAQLAEEIEKEKDIYKQLDDYKKQLERLQTRSVQVDEILKTRTNPRKILEKIARSIPEDVWLDHLEINDVNEVRISGGSYSPRSVGEFISLVNDSLYFGGTIAPSLQENRREVFDGTSVNYEYFELKGKVINYDMRAN